MSLYTNNVRTRLLDPVYHRSQSRSEFRLPTDTVLLANMRLLNLGVRSDPSSQSSNYNLLVGAHGVIKNIRLLDKNNTILDSVEDYNIWAAFKNYNKTNEYNINLGRTLDRTSLGFVSVNDDDDGDPTLIQPMPINNRSNSIENTVNDDETARIWLSLDRVFPMLAAAKFVPTTVFKNMRLVIEYEKDTTKFAVDDGPTYINTEPLLVVDELLDSSVKDQISQNFKELNWVALEKDKVRVPAVTGLTDNEIQNLSFNLKGFNNKVLGRMLITKTPVDTNQVSLSENVYRKVASLGQQDQKVQLRVNGKNLLPGQGLTKQAETLARLTATWGDCNSIVNELTCNDTSNVVLLESTVGVTDYIGLDVGGDRVQDLQLEYERLNVFDPSGTSNTDELYNGPLDLNVFGEVQKTIKVNNGKYNISYQ